MKPITIELTPSEALHLLSVMGIYISARKVQGKPYAVSVRIHRKVDLAIQDATVRDEIVPERTPRR